MSFLRYAFDPDVLRGNGRGPLSFHRARVDGLPYRGAPHMLKEEEFRSLAEVVHETYVAEFNLSIPEQLQAWREVYSRIMNRLYRCTCIVRERVTQPDGSQPMVVYVEYTEPALEVPQSRLPYME
jgi:hypothetical protein